MIEVIIKKFEEISGMPNKREVKHQVIKDKQRSFYTRTQKSKRTVLTSDGLEIQEAKGVDNKGKGRQQYRSL
jgi:hypothetical protein